jgi:hypothetical protein
MSIGRAVKLPDSFQPSVQTAVDTEMEKHFITFETMKEVSYDFIPSNAVKLHSLGIVKLKRDGRVTFRLAIDGKAQPTDSYLSTYAPTACGESKLCALAALSAECKFLGIIEDLEVSDLDVVGAFLHGQLTPDNCPRRIFAQLPKNLPGRLAGKWVELYKAVYGLKQSNNIFSNLQHNVLVEGGFLPTPEDSCIYTKTAISTDGITRRIIISTHVDDAWIFHNYKPLYKDLISVFTTKFGPCTVNDISQQHCGMEISRTNDNDIFLSHSAYLKKFLTSVGASDLSYRPTPSPPDLFYRKPGQTLSTKETELYSKIIGALIFVLPTRPDIRKETIFLSSRGRCIPTSTDMDLLIYLLSYIWHTINFGLTFATSDGPTLFGFEDASYAVHSDYRSHAGYYLTIGRSSAPFASHSKAIMSDFATGSMEAEYMTLALLTKRIIYFRNLLASLGFPQNKPTIIYEDNLSAIKLTVAPQIPRKSKHIGVRYHYTRDMVQQNNIQLIHLRTTSMPADLLTKPLGPTLFVRFRDMLLNIKTKVTSQHGVKEEHSRTLHSPKTCSITHL